MAQRCHHYERAFEAFLRARRIPYISVDEARKALLPDDGGIASAIKSFDFVAYLGPTNLLVEVKGRKVPAPKPGSNARGRMECWVSREDTESLAEWERLFGEGFEACFAFMYWCEGHPPDGLFNEVFEHAGRWYAVRSVLLTDYLTHMRPRSRRWDTVHLATADFERLSRPMLGGPPAPERRAASA